MDPKSNDWYPYRKAKTGVPIRRPREGTYTQGDCHVVTKAEIDSPSQKLPRIAGHFGGQREARKDLPRESGKSMVLPTSPLGPLDSRAEREHSSLF